MSRKILSKSEEIIENYEDVFLTNKRLIRYSESRGNTDYKDIRLKHITSFSHSKKFNELMAALGGLILFGGFLLSYSSLPTEIPLLSVVLGAFLIIWAFIAVERKHTVHSTNPDVSMNLPENSDIFEFLKKVNEQIE